MNREEKNLKIRSDNRAKQTKLYSDLERSRPRTEKNADSRRVFSRRDLDFYIC